jgi:hypothetical protein
MTRIGEDRVGFLRAMLEPVLPHLDEKARRLVVGAAAGALGHGGILAVARASGLSPDTVSDGMWELAEGTVAAGRVRRAGAGRKPAAEKDPGLVPALLSLVEPTRRGDPMGSLAWTTVSTRDLAGELAGAGHPVSYRTVRLLLRANGFVLRGNAKVLEGASHPDRDGQFRHINDTAEQFLGAGQPVVSVDAKKKEPVGDFANPGRTWHPADAPVKVRDHDFLDPALGTAIPFGVYDLGANSGWVNVGVDRNTAAFAVESIRRWWAGAGRDRYPEATRLLVCADAGGPNAAGSWVFKAELAAFAAESGLDVTVAHYPPGASKWNKIEHRLFSAISMNWRGRPLTSLQVIVDAIAATGNASGLTVRAELDEGSYPTGAKVTARQRQALPLDRHDWHGDWNYTVRHVPGWRLPEALDPPRPPSRPDTAWLLDPRITGIDDPLWQALVGYLQPPEPPPGARGPRPGTVGLLTVQDKLLAAVLNRRHRLTQTDIAALFGVSRETVKAAVPATVRALAVIGHALTPAAQPLRTLDQLAAANHPPTEIKSGF